MEDSQREAMFNAWKEKHDREVKKCVCVTPNPRPTDKNNCWDCNGEIYKDYLQKVRWHQNDEQINIKDKNMTHEDYIKTDRWFAWRPVKTTNAGWVWWKVVNRTIDERSEVYLGLLPEYSYCL